MPATFASSSLPSNADHLASERGATSPAPWHARSGSDALRSLGSTADGLAVDEVQRRLAEHGPNALPRAEPEGALRLLWRQINSPLIWVLIASGVIAMVADWQGDGIKNGLVILAVVVLNSVIGFVQEFRAGRAIEALTKMMPESITVIRDGRRLSVAVADVVPGDIVTVSSGDRVPADSRLLQSRGLRIEEAALTGESVPAEKSPHEVDPAAALGDRVCMLYAGTLVTSGTGTAVVVATGAATELGRISALLEETTSLETPMTRALRSIGLWISIGIVVVALLILVLGTARTMIVTGDPLFTALRETVIFAIALAVGAIPEGLPAIVTIALAIGVQRMSRRQAIVRQLPVVETLGSTTVICSDKTGTLTRNEMTVRALWTPETGRVNVEGTGYEPTGAFVATGDEVLTRPPAETLELLRAATLCSDAALTEQGGRFMIAGDPTEGALVVALRKAGITEDRARDEAPRLDAIPFESERQYMATLHREGEGSRPRMIVKGAPEIIFARCSTGLDREHQTQLTTMARDGMRVLAVAERAGLQSDTLAEEDVANLRLLGLVGMIDPPRQEAIEAIAACHRAGITVKMITGDHHATAAAIGRQLNLISAEGRSVAGAELGGMSESELRRVAARENVFARVAPEHKLRLVRALQAEGEVVAMTGDGVNDAPALKQANIGVAMGITGTTVSKEAAAVVLTDDNFASIAAAVEEGRRVYDNLVKSLAFVLPTNIGLALILLTAVAVFPFDADTGTLLQPMSPLQLLWINLVATVALALPLAFEAPEPDVMNRPPRAPAAPILSSFVVYRTFLVAVIMTIGAIATFLFIGRGAVEGGVALARGQTAAVTTVILFQVFYLLNCRSLRGSIFSIGLFSNRAIFIGIPVILLLQALFIYLPPLQAVFDTVAIKATDLLVCAGIASTVMPIIALEKWLRRRSRSGESEGGRP